MDKNLLKYTFGGEREPTFFQNSFYRKIYSMEYSVFWFLFGTGPFRQVPYWEVYYHGIYKYIAAVSVTFYIDFLYKMVVYVRSRCRFSKYSVVISPVI